MSNSLPIGILILPLVLFIVMTELSVGEFVVLYWLDYRNEVKRNFLVTYGIIYVFFTGITYLFGLQFSSPSLLNTFARVDKGWTGYLLPLLLTTMVLMIPYNIFLWRDKNAGVDGKEQSSGSMARILRLIFGGLVALAGLATLLVLAMIYRPLGGSTLTGICIVAGFFASTLALGGVMTAMWLGHWYLVTPALSEKPLLFATTLVLIGVLAEVILTFAGGPTTTYANQPATATPVVAATATAQAQAAATATHGTKTRPANIPVVTPLGTDAISWLRILVAFIIPLVLGGLAWKLVRDRSFQSATGMLYLVVVCALAGEAIARGLFLMGLS